MKARYLKKLLNNTGYFVHNTKEKICVGSPMCHDLINVNKKTLKLRYELDTFYEGRNYVVSRSNEDLLFVYDKLQELIDSGEINDIINGQDEIENPIKIYMVVRGVLVETFTCEERRITIDGYALYNNNWSDDKNEAIKQGLKELQYFAKTIGENIKEKEQKILEDKKRFSNIVEQIKTLQDEFKK